MSPFDDLAPDSTPGLATGMTAASAAKTTLSRRMGDAKDLDIQDLLGLKRANWLLRSAGVDDDLRWGYMQEAHRILDASSVTFVHSLCVTALSIDYVDMVYNDADHTRTAAAALLHDIGKLAMPHRIRSRKAKLETPEEAASIYNHPKMGAGMMHDRFPKAAYISAHHHKRPNGTGYGTDFRLSEGEDITKAVCLVVSAFDYLDAMDHGSGESLSIAKFNPCDKQDVIRAMSDHFYTPKGGAIVERHPFIEHVVEFYWRHRPGDAQYMTLMRGVVDEMHSRKETRKKME